VYTGYYKLTAKPFQLAPDSRFFFNSAAHKRALSYLLYGLNQGEGFIVITGDIGTGKTTLVNTLYDRLGEDQVVYGKIVTTQISEDELLKVVAAEFGLAYEGRSKGELLKDLELFFRECVYAGKRALLLVDEAQNLPRRSVEELRMLSNFEYKRKPLLQTFLLGQREFRNVMRSKEFEQLRQRVIAAYHLRPLEQEELRQYIEHRLRLVSWQEDPSFRDEVFQTIYEYTQGIPRKINLFCDRLLLLAAMEELHIIEDETAKQVIAELSEEFIGDVIDPLPSSDRLAEQPVQSEVERSSGGGERRIKELEHSLETLQTALKEEIATLRDAILEGSKLAGTKKKTTTRKKAAAGRKKTTRKKATKKKAAKATTKCAPRKKAAKATTKRAPRKKATNVGPDAAAAAKRAHEDKELELAATIAVARDLENVVELPFFDVTGSSKEKEPSSVEAKEDHGQDSGEDPPQREDQAPTHESAKNLEALRALERLVKDQA
jgi:putative secretion ATPase (PEP-CTERM system associated)